jgi:two-component system nitrogen regulation sensor histidine kinase NtrY
MILQRFYINVIVRIIILVITAIGFAWSLIHLNHLFTILVMSALIVVQSVLLIRYINQVNTDLIMFLSAIRNEDSSVTYRLSSKKGTYSKLKILLDELNSSISRVKIDKENQLQYLTYVLEHVDTGMIAFNDRGSVELINRQAIQFFQLGEIRNINRLNSLYPDFKSLLLDLKPSQNRLLMVNINNNILQLSLRKTRFKIEGRMINLVSFQNIQAELSQKELETWQKLIRVLRHEIVNTVSPIASLATTLSRIFRSGNREKSLKELNDRHIRDALSGIQIIHDRSRGLIDFVEQYKQITQLPEPEFERINLQDVLHGLITLFREELSTAGIKLEQDCPLGIFVHADKNLLEQVLINLIRNSIEALKDRPSPRIILRSFRDGEDRTVIQVSDNGPGIQSNMLDDIFVPFFSTKEKGSGIGLSLSRQIMNLHKGSITVRSTPEKETVFNLVF